MKTDLEREVLGAMLRMARHRRAAEDDEISLRVGRPASLARRAVRRLQAAGLVETRQGRAARLTLAGLAAAVSLAGDGRARVGDRVNATSRAA